jgi:hypothetical protein
MAFEWLISNAAGVLGEKVVNWGLIFFHLWFKIMML